MSFLASPLNRALVIVAIAAIIGALSYFTVIQPALTQYNDSQARLAQDVQTYNDLKRVADQRPTYLALQKQIQSRLGKVELWADPRGYIPSYLKQIEDLAKNDGLQVTAVTPQVTPAPTPGPSAAPGSSPNPQSLTNIAPIGSAVKAAGGANAQAQATNNVATQTGATPIPGGSAPHPSGSAAPGAGPLQAGAAAPSTARQNAIAYLTQSFTQVPINMEFAGTYAQLQKFLRDLNRFPKLIGVGNVTLTPGAKQDVGVTPTLNILLPIIAYRLSPSGAAQQPAVPPASNGPIAPGQNGG